MATDRTTEITNLSKIDSGTAYGKTIAPGLRADVMRKLMETKNTLTNKGSIYVGTGNYETVSVGSDYCKIYETKALDKPANSGYFLTTTADGLEYPTALRLQNSNSGSLYSKNGFESGNQITVDSGGISVVSGNITASSGNITASGTVTAGGRIQGASFNATSDRRLKENIVPLEKPDGILDLPLYEYDFKDTGVHSLGCMAQDLKEIAPLLVDEDEEGYLSIKESKLVYYLLMEVRALRDEIKALKKGE